VNPEVEDVNVDVPSRVYCSGRSVFAEVSFSAGGLCLASEGRRGGEGGGENRYL
jgi:hypothetical protein